MCLWLLHHILRWWRASDSQQAIIATQLAVAFQDKLEPFAIIAPTTLLAPCYAHLLPLHIREQIYIKHSLCPLHMNKITTNCLVSSCAEVKSSSLTLGPIGPIRWSLLGQVKNSPYDDSMMLSQQITQHIHVANSLHGYLWWCVFKSSLYVGCHGDRSLGQAIAYCLLLTR